MTFLRFNFPYLKNKMDEIFDQFGLTFLGREGIKTYFRINANQDVYIEIIVKLLCFYTAALFETDSINRRIFYKIDGDILYEKFDNILPKLFKEFMFNDDEITPKSKISPKVENYIDNKIIIPNNLDTLTILENLPKDIVNMIFDYVCPKDEEYQDQHIYKQIYNKQNGIKKYKDTPVIKYKLKHSLCQGEAMVAGEDEDEFPTLKILKELGEYKEVACSSFSVNKTTRVIKCTTTEEKYVCFDFDTFKIDAQCISLSDSETGWKYQCTFSKINHIHHAASMWARNCLVEFMDTQITQIKLVNSMDIILEKDNEFIYATASYLAINCL